MGAKSPDFALYTALTRGITETLSLYKRDLPLYGGDV